MLDRDGCTLEPNPLPVKQAGRQLEPAGESDIRFQLRLLIALPGGNLE